MKKFLSLILALAMVACMSVTAFAEEGPGGSAVLSVNVPNKPLYTLNIPAAQTIEYGKTETNIGKVTVSDVDDTVNSILADCRWTNFTDGDNSIPLAIVFDQYNAGELIMNHKNPVSWAETVYKADASGANRYCEYFAQVTESDWAAAVPGDYSATVTWTSTYTLK